MERDKGLKVIFLLLILFSLFIFYNYYFNKPSSQESVNSQGDSSEKVVVKPKIALIFGGVGGSLKELKQVSSLNIPLTVSVIPGLRFSKNIAYISQRCGFSVLIQLPWEEIISNVNSGGKYSFTGDFLFRKKIGRLLRYYLNYVRIARGVVSCLSLKEEFIEDVLRMIKQKNWVFISCPLPSSALFYKIARKIGLSYECYEQIFVPPYEEDTVRKEVDEMIKRAVAKGKIIVVVPPEERIIEVLRQRLVSLKEKVNFLTITDYFSH